MTTKKLTTSTDSTAQSIAKLFAVGALSTGAVAVCLAAPAGAVIFGTSGANAGQQLSFNGYTQDFYQKIGSGANFSVNFSQSGSVNTAAGSPVGSQLATLFPPGVTSITPTTGNFTYVSGSGNNLVYNLSNPSDLVFSFANNIDYIVKSGSRFTTTYNNGIQGVQFNIANDAGSFFRDRSNGDITLANTSVFQFADLPSVVGGNFAGNYQIIASPASATAVPEPFTVIGTMLGGAAALRMRKRLKVENKL